MRFAISEIVDDTSFDSECSRSFRSKVNSVMVCKALRNNTRGTTTVPPKEGWLISGISGGNILLSRLSYRLLQQRRHYVMNGWRDRIG